MPPPTSFLDRWWPEAALMNPGWRRLFSARELLTLIVAAASLQLLERIGYFTGATLFLGTLAVAGAAPIGAVLVMESEIKGHLDQLRLYGMATGALAWATMVGGVLPFLVVGLTLLSFSPAASIELAPLLAIGFAIGSAVGIVALLGGFLWRPFAGQAIAIAGVLAALALAAQAAAGIESVGRLSTLATTAAIGLPVLFTLACGRPMLRAMQRPHPPQIGRPVSAPIPLPLAIGPEAARILRLALPAACLCLVVVILGGAALLMIGNHRVGPTRALVYSPFLILLIMVVASGREEAMNGRLSVLHGAPIAPARVLAQVLAGWVVPFAPAVAAAMAFAVANGHGSLALFGPIVAATLLVPAAVTEGWLAPAARHLLGLVSAMPLLLVIIAFQRDVWVALVEIACVGWIPFAAAISAYQRPTDPRPPLPVRVAMLTGVAASLLGIVLSTRQGAFAQGFWLAAWVLMMGPLIAGAGRREGLIMGSAVLAVAGASAAATSLTLIAAVVASLGVIVALGVTSYIERIASPVPALLVRGSLAYLVMMVSIAPTPLEQYELTWFSKPYMRDPLFTAVRIGALVVAAAVAVAAVRVYTRRAR